MSNRIEIPYEEVAPETLQAIIEAFVLHEGTNYGDKEVQLTTMVEQVRRQLERGQVKLVYDAEQESCNLITERQWRDATKAPEDGLTQDFETSQLPKASHQDDPLL